MAATTCSERDLVVADPQREALVAIAVGSTVLVANELHNRLRPRQLPIVEATPAG